MNKDGYSDWATFSTTTKSNPLEFAIRDIKAQVTCEDQPGQTVAKLFDFDTKSGWHTKWGKGEAVPFDMNLDLRSVSKLDRIAYLPRENAGNGTLLGGSVSYSTDRQNWSAPVAFTWAQDGTEKTFAFEGNPEARYVKIHIDKAVGNFGSGSEMYIFKVAGSESFYQGDINKDKRIDDNDLTSYMNYTGLRKGDGDFDYVSAGDINKNGLIDAYDISAVAIELEGGVSSRKVPAVEGQVTVKADKTAFNAGDELTITVEGKRLKSVNALSLCLPYDATLLEYVGVQADGIAQMYNMTYDRLHTDGHKALYPTFVNLGEQPYAEGDKVLFTLKMRAKKKGKFAPKYYDGMLVDKYQNVVKF